MALAEFEYAADMVRVRDGGPWQCLNTVALLHDWCLDLALEEIRMNRLGVWAQLHNLSIGVMVTDRDTGEKLASHVGKFIKVDTEETKKKFIRVRVEIDIDKPVVTGFFLRWPNRDPLWISVKYKRMSSLCTGCGRLSHEGGNREASSGRLWISSDGPNEGFKERDKSGLRPTYTGNPESRVELPRGWKGKETDMARSKEEKLKKRTKGDLRSRFHPYQRNESTRCDDETREAVVFLQEGSAGTADDGHLLELSLHGGAATVRALANLVRANNPLVKGLVETKVRKYRADRVKMEVGFQNGFVVESREELSLHTPISGKHFGKVKSKIKELQGELIRLQEMERTDEVTEQEVKITRDLDEWFLREELLWKQRSSSSDTRIGWNEWMSVVPRKLNDEMRSELIRPYSEAEVREAVFQMCLTKASGPDGFLALFYQKNWSLIKGKVATQIPRMQNRRMLEDGINKTLITLIPKVKNLETAGDYRPISLCNVGIKIITKMLANKLKPILPTIISENQGAFVPGKIISDNIITAQELIHFIRTMSRQKVGYFALKVDISKVYDRVEWDFLEVMICVKTVSYAVPVNDLVNEEVKPGRGIRQGDPLSPFLFLICSEWLNLKIKEYQRKCKLNGVKICRGAPEIEHLLFADDSIFFLRADMKDAENIKKILEEYETLSGQKINLSTFKIYFGRNIVESDRQIISEVLGVRQVETLSKYL
ncbi:hypothetical protein QQ045_000885 [Rhodiola kirilowii]